MKEKFMAQVKFERMCKARKKAREDPRVKELQEEINKLIKKRDELIEEISDNIYTEMNGS